MKVTVQELRDQIKHLSRIINYDAKVCAHECEKVGVVKRAKIAGSELIDMECLRAKESDLMDKERALDMSFTFIYNNSSLIAEA